MAWEAERSGVRGVTLREVAQEAGVNAATASVALNGSKSSTVVAEATRRRIVDAAQRLGYAPNPHAQRLARGAGNTVALVPGLIDAGVHSRLLAEVRSRLSEGGHRVPVYMRSSAQHEDESVAEVLGHVVRQQPRAIVCGMHDVGGHLRGYCERGGVVVLYDALHHEEDSPFSSVGFDKAHGIEQAARHLLELGHRRIGFFNGGVERWGGDWMRGFGRALAGYGLAPRDEWRFCGGDPWFQLEEGGALLAEQFLALPPSHRPTGLCVLNDSAAVTFIAALERAGLSVPRDVSVVGFDDLPIAALNRPAISSLRKPLAAIAAHAVALLHDRLEGRAQGPGRQIIVRGELVPRESTSPPPPGS